jgi:4-amino-4-deoxy-L-arabinose transferase-like glycosyltransferase
MVDFPLKNHYKFRVRITKARLLVLSIISALILRLYLLFTSMNPINSDEALIGLMARHILKGEHPLLFYGQNYYGPLESYFTAPLFAVFGSNRIILKIVPLVSSLLFIYAIYWLGTTLYSESIGLYSAVYAALPPAMLTVRQLQADAAYPLVLLVGTFSLLIFNRLQSRFSWIRLGVLICLFGLGFWLHPIMGYYLASTGLIYLFYKLNISRYKLTVSSRIILIFSLVLVGIVSLFFWGGIDFLTRMGKYLIDIITIALPVVFGIFKPYDQINKFAIDHY